MASPKRISDGSVDFSGGVDSARVSTLQSAANPNGLKRNQLAWLTNGTVRGGGILQRTGWTKLGTILESPKLYQGGWMYVPDGAFPHLILSIAGEIYKVSIPVASTGDLFGVSNLSTLLGFSNPPNETLAHMVQGEQFLIIQAGDMVTLPLFYDGSTMRRSNGLGGSPVEIPAAGPMDYYMGRLWYAGVPDNRTYCAGDIVKGSSGTAPYALRDSILRVTENPVAVGGDGFVIPTSAGAIRAIRHSANIDTTLGEGELFIFTRKSVYSLKVPVTRAQWIAADTDNAPVQKVVQINYGTNAERSVLSINGDMFYQSVDGIRSLTIARRSFQQWGNTPISRNINRLLQFNDRGQMQWSSGIEFGNRMYQTASPIDTPAGVAYRTLAVLDFDVISTMDEKLPPVWEGCNEGLNILQLFEGDFGGMKRAFAVVCSRETEAIELWELTDSERRDNGDNRVTWYFETPAFTWGNEFQLKELETLELWIDKLYGTSIFTVEYRPDSDPCWHHWFKWKMCSARNSCENLENPVCYPIDTYRETYRATARLPKPQMNECATGISRPAAIGYQFQLRITIKGWCRVRGFLIHAMERELQLLADPVCEPNYGMQLDESEDPPV